MPSISEYEFKLDLYHNNYVASQQLLIGIEEAKIENDLRKIMLYQSLESRVITEEAEFFEDGVKVAGEAKKFAKDVLKAYPDLIDSTLFRKRLKEVGLAIIGSGLEDEQGSINSVIPESTVDQLTGLMISTIKDSRTGFTYAHQQDFTRFEFAKKTNT